MSAQISATPAELSPLVDSSQSAISADTMRDVIAHTQKLVLLSPKVIQDPVLKQYIQGLGLRLVKHVDHVQYPYTFFLIQHDDINAFASLGNFIGVHSGLLLATHSESELAAVLAHEVSHCQQQHLQHMIQHTQDMKLPMLLGVVGALGLSILNPNLGQGLLVAGAAGLQQDMINYTRSFEREADQIGIVLLHKSGFSVDAMASFFGRLQQKERYYDNPTSSFLRTHPVTTSRIAQAKNAAAGLTHKQPKESIEYAFMRERLRVLGNQQLKTLHDDYRLKLRKHPEQDALYYGAALTALKLGRYQQALKLLQQIPHHQQHWIIQLAKSRAIAHLKPQHALTLLKTLYQQDSDNYAVILAYAEQLKRLGQYRQALRVLKLGLITRRADPILWWTISETENKAGHKAYAYFAAAHAQRLLDKRERAIKFLKLAQKIGKNDRDLQAKIQTLLHEWRPKPNR